MAVDFLGLIFGDDGTGYKLPDYADIRAAVAKKITTDRGIANLNTDPGSIFGDIVDLVTTGIYVAGQSSSDAVSRTLFASMMGVALDQFLSDILVRVQATPSQAILWVYGTAGGNFPINTSVRTSPAGTAFQTTGAVVVPAAPSDAYGIEIENFAAGAYSGQNFTVTVDGIPVIVGANNLTTGLIMKNNLVTAIDLLGLTQDAWDGGVNPTNTKPTLMVIEGQGGGVFPLSVNGPPGAITAYQAVSVVVTTGTVTGPIPANVVALRYAPPFPNVVGVTNVLQAVQGAFRETDSQFRARHQVTQRGLGGGSPDAIRGIMLSPVAVRGGGCSSCSVEYNPTDSTDAADNLPHSIRVIVNQGAFPQDVGKAIFRAKAAGDNTNGDELVVIQDLEGNNQEVRFDYLVDRWISANITISVGPDWPNTGDPTSQLRQDVTDFINALQPGGDGGGVRVNELPISLYPNGTPRGVTNFNVALSASFIQAGPYNDPAHAAWPSAEPNANVASINASTDTVPPLTSRQKPKADISFIFVTIV